MAEIRGTARTVPLADVRPNPWNYNEQPPETFAKLVRSIERSGFAQPIVTRWLADDGVHEIVNGEHRWKAAGALGMTDVPIFDLGELDDARAKELAIVLNELAGQPNQLKLADLLAELASVNGREVLAEVMPLSTKELETLLASADTSFVDQVNAVAAEQVAAADAGDGSAYVARQEYTCRVYGPDLEVVNRVLEKRFGLKAGRGTTQKLGEALAALCKDADEGSGDDGADDHAKA